MGCWDDDGLHITDGGLDAAGAFVHKMAQAYRTVHGRYPTIDEVIHCITHVLKNEAEQFIEDGTKYLITDLTIKKRRRPKKQEYRSGDIFAIPLRDGTFAFAHVSPQYLLAEFFIIRSRRLLSISTLKQIDTFRLDTGIDYTPLEQWRWQIIGHLPYQNGEFQMQHYRVGNQITCGTELDRNGFIHPSSAFRRATSVEASQYPQCGLTFEEILLEELEERLEHALIDDKCVGLH